MILLKSNNTNLVVDGELIYDKSKAVNLVKEVRNKRLNTTSNFDNFDPSLRKKVHDKALDMNENSKLFNVDN